MISIGIDPDIKASGFAVWDEVEQKLLTNLTIALSFWDLIDEFEYYNSDKIKVFIEAGWLNKKSNFHSFPNQKKEVGEIIAKKVGANHQIGKLIEEYCILHKISYELVKPTSQKWTRKYCKQITGLDINNQDIIDAVRLVFGRAKTGYVPPVRK